MPNHHSKPIQKYSKPLVAVLMFILLALPLPTWSITGTLILENKSKTAFTIIGHYQLKNSYAYRQHALRPSFHGSVLNPNDKKQLTINLDQEGYDEQNALLIQLYYLQTTRSGSYPQQAASLIIGSDEAGIHLKQAQGNSHYTLNEVRYITSSQPTPTHSDSNPNHSNLLDTPSSPSEAPTPPDYNKKQIHLVINDQ